MVYKSNNNIVYDCKYHVIWCPKYRKPVLKGDVEKILKNILPYKSEELGAKIIEMEIDLDHIHLLISCDQQYGIHKVVKVLKGFSSRVLRENFPHLKSTLPTLWTNNYFVSTVGSVSLDVVKQYIRKSTS